MRRDIFVIDGKRTPIGGMGKSLKNISAVALAAGVLKSLFDKSAALDKAYLDEVILGNVVSAGLGQNPARQALMQSGLSPDIPAFTLNKVCGSGLKAVVLAAQAIQCGDADMIAAGGTESASQTPYLVPRVSGSKSVAPGKEIDSLINDGLWCSFSGMHMVDIAEYTAKKFKVSREEQDSYAIESHRKASGARGKGLFRGEIFPVDLGEERVFSEDEKPRDNMTPERMAKLPPVTGADGTITAGNSPAPADGAAALILASEKAVREAGMSPVARILGYASVAVEPKMVFTAPGLAIGKCMKNTSLKADDIDLFEVNEAFAVQALITLRNTGIDPARLNIYGGTIALGHPLGASGARGLVTLINALKNEGKKTGMTAICLGGGCAMAVAVERV